MKTLKCDLCEATADGETFEQWMRAIMPHYMQAHADIMKSKTGLTDEEKKVEQQKWLVENRTRFNATPELNK